MNAVAEFPYAVKSTKVIWMIQNDPPPTPLCFDSRGQWQDYLMYLEASGERITRRQDLGKHAKSRLRVVTTVFDRIDYCRDCHVGGERQRAMQATGRCILPVQVEAVSEPARESPHPSAPREPKGTRAVIAQRRAQAWEEFNGHNHATLAQRFFWSMRTVYRALAVMRRDYVRAVQRDWIVELQA